MLPNHSKLVDCGGKSKETNLKSDSTEENKAQESEKGDSAIESIKRTCEDKLREICESLKTSLSISPAVNIEPGKQLTESLHDSEIGGMPSTEDVSIVKSLAFGGEDEFFNADSKLNASVADVSDERVAYHRATMAKVARSRLLAMGVGLRPSTCCIPPPPPGFMTVARRRHRSWPYPGAGRCRGDVIDISLDRLGLGKRHRSVRTISEDQGSRNRGYWPVNHRTLIAPAKFRPCTKPGSKVRLVRPARLKVIKPSDDCVICQRRKLEKCVCQKHLSLCRNAGDAFDGAGRRTVDFAQLAGQSNSANSSGSEVLFDGCFRERVMPSDLGRPATPSAKRSASPPKADGRSCSEQARNPGGMDIVNVNELAGYLEDSLYMPKEMSQMAKGMYT